MKRFLGTVVLFTMTLGWWGFVYPELCLTPEEDDRAEEVQESALMIIEGKDAGQETICIKSRLYEYICQHKEAAYD